MLTFIARRLGFFVVAEFAASILIFALIRAAGGNVAAVMLGRNASAEAIAELETKMGLNRPLFEQYWSWATGMLQGDFGTALQTGRPVAEMVAEALPISAPLTVMALALALMIAIPAGSYAAVKTGKPVGTLIVFFSQAGIAVPVFWAGVLLALVFGVRLRILPTGGWVPWQESPAGAFTSLILPALAQALVLAASLTRYVRTAVMDVMNEEYVRTARAGGMTRRKALMAVGLRNASIPILTVVGMQIIDVITGAVLIETVFSLPGLGRMLLSSVAAREVIVVQSSVMLIVTFVLVVNLVIDLVYGALDPRVSVGSR